MFSFYFNTRVEFGIGARNRLADILTDNNWNSVGVVIDHNLYDVPIFKELLLDLKNVSSEVVLDLCRIAEPTYDALEELRGVFDNHKLDVIIGIGGGSALDMAKAMAVLVNNREPAIFYRGFDKMTEPVLPVIAIPTTAGTGSEVTPNASFVDSHEKKKMGINGEAIRPKYAILDPELTLTCPEKPTISAAIDSIVHAVEAYVAKKTNPLARLFAKEGFRYVFNHLPLVIKEPLNIELREKVMYGAHLSGIALMNSGTGPAAAMSYPLGVHFKVPHGIGGGVFLPYVIDYNVKQGLCDYADLYETVERNASQLSQQEKAELFAEKIFSLWRDLSIPADLTTFGVDSSFVPRFVQETLDLKGALDQNPVPFYEQEIKRTLEQLNV